MGCCNSRKNKAKNASNLIEEINIESQEKELINILTEVNKKIDNAKTTLDASGIHYVVLGNGNKVMKQTPSSGDVITTGDTIYLITNDSSIKVPNVVGLSSKVAKDLLTKLGVKVNLDGVGYVVSQSLPEGTDITEGLVIDLTLSPKFAAE